MPAQNPPSSLSHSQVELYQTCPAAWNFLYLRRLPRLKGRAGTLGTALHRVIEAAYRGWMFTGTRRQIFPELFGRDGDLESALKLSGAAATREDLVGCRTALANLCRLSEGVFDPDTTVQVEYRFDMALEGLSVPVIGYIDRIDLVGPFGLKVVDYKTGRREPDDEMLTTTFKQLGLYAIVAALLYSAEGPVTAELWHLRSGKTWSRDLSADDRKRVEVEFARLGTEMHMAETFPYELGGHCVWCEAREHCPAFAQMKM